MHACLDYSSTSDHDSTLAMQPPSTTSSSFLIDIPSRKLLVNGLPASWAKDWCGWKERTIDDNDVLCRMLSSVQGSETNSLFSRT